MTGLNVLHWQWKHAINFRFTSHTTRGCASCVTTKREVPISFLVHMSSFYGLTTNHLSTATQHHTISTILRTFY